ncbi:30S ribosome-binding factor RbfA [Phosphitispora fastidiosa]|uniref:30S ribosome-binding factor RbfA n=1 Tax=Phosphitispora fastidiosa TaxID=2837202 RepID=UPI001E3DD44D|nr:30S ribosome-binding factor RbfA [Phosphitispora fastidiosa]MBU7005589.1 ribosome-binding factor A [Phosphitispora fastidiosa]
MTSHRANRVAEEIKKEITQMLREEIKDPRIGFVTVTGAEVTPDIRYAKVFVSIYGDDDAKVQSMQALEKAKGFVRSELGKRIRLRYTPEVTFRFDSSIEYGARIMKLLEEVKDTEKET